MLITYLCFMDKRETNSSFMGTLCANYYFKNNNECFPHTLYSLSQIKLSQFEAEKKVCELNDKTGANMIVTD